MKQLLLFIFVFIVLLPHSQSQTPFFKVNDLDKTLINTTISVAFEDLNTILWLGTSDGLFQYDGNIFIPFLKSDSSSSRVTAIFQDHTNTIWVGYHDGSIFQLVNHKLIPWSPGNGIITKPITGFVEDEANRIWIATYGAGGYYYSEEQLVNLSMDDGLLSDDIYVMHKDLNEKIWLGTDSGISICEIKDKEVSIEELTKEDGLPDDIVKEIVSDRDGNLWIGMYDKGICFFDLETQKFKYPLAKFEGGEVTTMALFKENELWIGTDGEGIWRFDLKKERYDQVEVQYPSFGSKIYDLVKDNEGSIWVISNASSITQANRHFDFIGTNFKNIQSLLVDDDNTIWIGTQRGLFTYGRGGNPIFKTILPELNLNVLSLYEDEFGILWIGTFGSGVYCYEPKTKKYRKLTETDGLSNNSVISMDGVDGKVWLATLGGVTEFEFSKSILEISKPAFKQFDQESGLGTNYTYKVFKDSQNRVWFASDGKGISVLDKGRLRNYTNAEIHTEKDSLASIPLKAVYSITEDVEGHIWLSSAEQGIFKFDGSDFTRFTITEELNDLEVSSLIRDKKGNILLVHSTGIGLIDPQTHHITYFGEEVGIENLEPNLNAVSLDQDNNIWIAGQNQLLKYTSLEDDLAIHPRTFISGVSVFLEPVDFINEFEFSHDENNLVFDYKGVWYTDPKAVKYRYKLEGYDMDWIHSSDTRATYSNLPPGNFSFRVMSTENDVFVNESIVHYDFEIRSPLWQRWWFLLSTLIGSILLFRWYQKKRDARLQKMNLLEKEKIESQLETLKAQINPHFLFNSFNTLVGIIEEDQDLAVEYVENLSDFYRSILQYRDKEIIPIQEELEIVQKYSFLIKKRFGVHFDLKIHLNGEPIYIAPFTLQVLVENAVKHNIISSDKPLHVEIGLVGKEFIEVKNNLQLKKVKPNSTAFGLQSIAQRYDLMTNKPIQIEESNGIFHVRIPVIK